MHGRFSNIGGRAPGLPPPQAFAYTHLHRHIHTNFNAQMLTTICMSTQRYIQRNTHTHTHTYIHRHCMYFPESKRWPAPLKDCKERILKISLSMRYINCITAHYTYQSMWTFLQSMQQCGCRVARTQVVTALHRSYTSRRFGFLQY